MNTHHKTILAENGCCSQCGQDLGGWTLVGIHRKNEADVNREGYCPACGQKVENKSSKENPDD